jgi:type IV pilus assembly protein PilZ
VTSGPPKAPEDDDANAADRRRDARAPIELKVEYKRLNSFFADYTRNISKGGTFIVTTKPLPIGTEFLFQLTIPNLDAPLQLNGKVAWIVDAEQATADQPAGMGIRFRYDTAEERAHVADTVEKLIVQSLGPFLARKLLDQADDEADEGSGKP